MGKRGTKRLLAQTLLRLSKTTPIDKITVRRIAAESGLSMQTYYNHFKNRAELVLYIHQSEGERLMEKLESGQYSFEELVLANIRFYAEHREFMYNALTNTHGQDSYAVASAKNAHRVFAEYIARKQGWSELSPETDAQLRLYIYGSTLLYADWAFCSKNQTEEEFARTLIDAIPEKLKPLLLGD